VMDTWQNERELRGSPDRVLGNLPYSSASAIVASFIERRLDAKRMVFTVQKEVAQRMTASPGTAAYSSFSVLCGSAGVMRILRDVGPECFFPVPEVVSSVVVFEPGITVLPGIHSTLVRSCFVSRRKTIRNNLKNSDLARQLGLKTLLSAAESAGINPDARAETVSPEVFLSFSRAVEKA
jgi:16S rRNA (adenine1518-N6/adenine1519-N6)-dimethyltransferase